MIGLCGASACGRPDVSDDTVAVSAAVVIPGTSVLGFETAGAWSVSSGAVAQVTSPRTQGASALQVTAPVNYTNLVSVSLASGLAPLASMTDSGAALLLDMQMPTTQPNNSYWGAIQLYISVPSKGVNNQYLGQTELTGQQLGTFQTYRFPMTDFVRSKLAGQTYTDLKFTVALNAPFGATGKYVFDNLRSTSPTARPVGSIPSVDLTASLATSPIVNTPGLANFTAGTIQIPASFHVRVGNAGTGTAKLELGFGTTTSVTCTYNASSDKTAYNFASCTTGNKAGDIVAAAFAKLTIVSADPAAPLTKIKAQLSYNLLGDQVGTKLVVPTPTYWGETGAEISAITTAWANAQVAAMPSVTSKTTLTLPIPEFAYVHGDGVPVNMLDGGPPPPPMDPPYDFRGSLQNGVGRNPSGMFDAYYRLYGNVQPAQAGTTFTSHFEANGVVGVRVLSADVDVLTAKATVDTDNGGTDGQGSIDPHSSGHVTAALFGATLLDESGTETTGVNVNWSTSATFDTPPIPIWIFSVKGGVIASVGFSLNAALAINGFQLTASPNASVSAHVFGGVNIGIASGGVNVTVQLIGIEIPVSATALLTVDPSPTVCGAAFVSDINGQVKVSSGGGSVDLVGTLGVCPFCVEGSMNIFHWPNKPVATINFPAPFPIHASIPLPGLDPSICHLPLSVSIGKPVGTTVYAGVQTPPSQASATRPAPRGELSLPLDCQYLTWSSTTPGVTFYPSAVGCNPQITFPAAGPTDLTVTALNQYGETGSKTVTIDVLPPPVTAFPQILAPQQDDLFPSGYDVTISGSVSGGTGAGTAVWTIDGNVVATQPYTSGANVTLPSFTHSVFSNNSYTVVLTVTDSSGVPQATAPVTFYSFLVK
jgi:hypothetical protein